MSKRRAYAIEYKVEVVKFAEIHTNRETGRKHKINESVVPTVNGNSKKQSYKNSVSNQLL